MNEELRERNIVETWASKYPEVMLWLNKLRIKDKNAFSLYRFCTWAGKTPTELLALKRDPSSNVVRNPVETAWEVRAQR